MKQILLPELGDGIKTAIVACWHRKAGDIVHKDDDILEVVTDKATFNVCADVDGKITKILVAEGQEAKVGEPLVTIEPVK